MWWGERLENRMDVQPGDLVHIPAGVPHITANLSDEEVTGVFATTDPNEHQEDVVLRPDLDGLIPELSAPHMKAPPFNR
jgi:uncharacterized RmlC-like cupin family protein